MKGRDGTEREFFEELVDWLCVGNERENKLNKTLKFYSQTVNED